METSIKDRCKQIRRGANEQPADWIGRFISTLLNRLADGLEGLEAELAAAAHEEPSDD